MRATLEFDLPEEETEHYYALNGASYAIVIEELDNYLRGELKYNSGEYSDKEAVILNKVRHKLVELMEELR